MSRDGDMRGELLIAELLRSGHKVRFRVYGTSMLGSIWSGDVVEVEPLCLRPLAVGDIALYQREGRLIAHRVVGLQTDHPRGPWWILRGDNLGVCDPPVAPNQILGRVRRVQSRYAFLVRSTLRKLKQRFSVPRPVRPLSDLGHVNR